MAYARIFQKLLQNFFVTMGRAPSTPMEWSKLRRQAMELARKEGGDPITGLPSISSKTTIEDLMTGPHISQGGPKGDRIWDFSKDLPTTGILQNRGNIIPFPKGRRTSPAVKAMMQKGDVQLGKAPKTTQGILDAKKDRHILMRDADEDIARIKKDNKSAIERFKEKFLKKDNVEDVYFDNPEDPRLYKPKDDPDKFYAGGLAPLVGEPSYAADFYDDRTPMAGGGAVAKFIEKLFMKASNDIRQGKGKWKGLSQSEWIKKHDDLTKMLKQWEWDGKKRLPPGAAEMLGMNDIQIANTVRKGGKKLPHKAEVDAQRQEQIMEEAYEEIRGGSGFTGDYKYDADILADSLATVQGKVYDDLADLERSGLYDQALKRVSQDMLKRREAKKALKDVEQKIELQMFDPKDRLPNQSGGPVDQEALIQMYLAEGLSYEEAVQAAQSATNLPWDTLKKAEGGIIRAGFPFGGQALKAIRAAWRANKDWGVGGPPYKPEKTSFNIKEMTKRTLGKELSLTDLRRLSESPLAGPQKGHFEDFNKQFKNIKAQVLREKMMERKLEAKAMIHAADQTMKDATKEFETAFGPLRDVKKQEMAKKITSQMTRQSKEALAEAKEGLKAIDIYMGMLQKKGRKLHAEGGRVSYSGGGRAGLPAITYGTPQMNMQGPQMPVSAPQPTGIPGANLQMNQMDLMQQKMQQTPWMQNQMQQGMGGMQNPQYKGQFRMPFGLGGMSRRAFMKMMAGAAALPFIAAKVDY